MRIFLKLSVWLFVLGLLAPLCAEASVLSLSSNLAAEALSESVPTALDPSNLTIADFDLEWVGTPIPGVRLRLGEKSMEWVRVSEVLTLPRARLLIEADDLASGTVSQEGFTQPLAISSDAGKGLGKAELPIALISGDKNAIDLRIHRGTTEMKSQILIKFHPKGDLAHGLAGGKRIYRDPSCSRFGLSVDTTDKDTDPASWMMVGCRLVFSQGDLHRTSSVEVFVFWDGVGQVIRVGGSGKDGIETPSSSASVWPLRLQSSPGSVSIVSMSGTEAKIRYFAPENLHLASIGFGLGPYWNNYQSDLENHNAYTLTATIYGSLFVNEAMRIVAFDATTLGSHWTSDLGVYLNTESVRVFDRRIILNIMLGGHAIGVQAEGQYRIFPGAPQGLELIAVDVLGAKGYNLSLGGFVYPYINGTSYYNIWLRFGSARFFGEFNYISWREWLDKGGGDLESIYSRSFGVSFGMPIARFF